MPFMRACSLPSPRRARRGRRAPRAYRIVPPALHAADRELPALGVRAVDVRDLELAAARRLELVDQLEHIGVVAVEPDDRIVRGWGVEALVHDPRLLGEVDDVPVLAVDDDPEPLGVGDLLDEDLRPVALFGPRADRFDLGELEEVVPEAHDELPGPGEALGHPDDLRDPARLGLHLVREVELEERLLRPARRHAAVAEQVDQLARVPLPRHDQHVLDARQLQELERVVDHRPAADREQVLVRDARQLTEPRRLAARSDDSFRPHERAMLTSGA